ncbi:MAG: lectin like domain-containing protein [Halobacteriota archaeon]
MTYKKLAAILLIALIALSVSGAIIQQSSSAAASSINATGALNTWSQAPINPAFAQYLKNQAAGNATTTVSGHQESLVPSTINFSTLAGQSVRAAAVPLVGYPSSYDLRALGKVSPVESQGTAPACWTFATYGSLESYLLPGTKASFSENNMKNLAGFDLTCEDGGNQQMATAYLARWGGSAQSGPVTTACDPFNQNSCTDTSLCSVQQHVQNVLFLPYRANPTDNSNIKWALQNYGGVYAVMWFDPSTSSNYNSNTAAYYYSGSTAPDHAVTIVGWNDSYPASNFASRPPGPGAFIVKNSWGTSFGKSGFFYVSYYDTQFATNSQPPTVFTAEPTTNYNTNYQYDSLGWVTNIGSTNIGSLSSNTAWGANVFTATSNQRLSAVSFYAGSVNTNYQIYVYTNPTSGPIGGTAYTGPNGTIATPGYYTLPLNTTVPLTAGQKFSVVIKITTPGSNYPIPVESTLQGYSSATGQPGQGYLSATGSSWTDATRVSANMSICIKAFTMKPQTSVTITPSTTTATVNQPVNFTATLKNGTAPLPSESVTIYHYLNGVRYNDTTKTTNAIGQITLTTSFGSPGTRTYYATFAGDSSYKASTSSVVTVNVTARTNVTLAASPTTPAVNQSVTFTATLSWWNPATGKWIVVATSGKPIQIWHTLNGIRYNDTTTYTNASGTATFTQKFASAGTRYYYATFAGDTWYTVSTSAVVTISVH